MQLTKEKLLFFISGIMIFTLGIVLTLQSELGVSPFDALLVGLHRTVGLTIGSWEIILGALMLLLNAMAVKRRPEYLGLLTAVVIGGCIDFWVIVLDGWVQPETLPGQMTCFIVGMAVNGFGIAAYLQANFAPVPFDRSMLVITELTRLSLVYSRAIIMIILVILAFLFNGPIGVGTLLITFLSGVIINFYVPLVEKVEKKVTMNRRKAYVHR